MMYQELDEQDLASLCLKGDRQAQEELYRRYAARLFTLCCRYSDNQDEARDLMHDTFLKAFDKISSFTCHGKGSLYSWICRIAINAALDSINRYKFRFVSLMPAISDELIEPDEEEIATIPQEKLLDLISGLPDTQRAIFNLFCLDGYKHKEIAAMLGISEKGSASLLAKAKAKLKKSIMDYLKASESNEEI